MSKRYSYDNEDDDYYDDQYEESKRSLRRLRKEPEKVNKKKDWDREVLYDYQDHDDRR